VKFAHRVLVMVEDDNVHGWIVPRCKLVTAPLGSGLSFCYRGVSMTIAMSSASLPVYRTMLDNLIHLLDQAQADAEARKFDPAALLQFRLAPDMLPFTRQ